jgi:hypothetical protein
LNFLGIAGRVKLRPITRNPEPEQLSTPLGTTDYRQLIPVYDFTGNQGLMNYWYGNQVPTAHMQTPPHAHYVSVRAWPVELQRRGIGWQGRVLSVVDASRMQAAMRAAWVKLST